ncbi:MAG: protein kinase domain-containing protein, partial [Planctomycetia bacterium]
HRDVKPANIFFDAFWGAFLGDFGIAKIVEESESFDRENTLTATNLGIGTLEYMGPEQFAPKPALDGRIDQYALAVTVYEMLAGTRPFTGTTAYLIVEVTTMPAPRLDRAVRGLPASLVDAVHRGLAKSPGDRFSTCGEFAYHTLRDVPLLADEPDIARLLCPKCSNILKLPVRAAGQKGKCPRCQTQMKVADDLGALWLLDEARRQRRAAASAVDAKDIKDDKEAAETGIGETGTEIDEEALEAFKPVSSTTPIEGEAQKQPRKIRTGMILAGLAAGVVAFAGLWTLFRKNSEPSDEQKIARAEEIIRLYPAANDFLGRHWCFEQKDWKKGLPYLAQSGTNALGATAQTQLDLEAANPPPGPSAMVELAQRWWTLTGQKGAVSADEVDAIKKHAASIYTATVDGLTDAKSIEDTNRWLERNPEFLEVVGGKRAQQQNTTKVIYLSELQELSSKVVHFGFGKGTINGLQNPIRSIIDGQPSPHGLSMHPGDGPDGACFVKYTLPEGVGRFTAIATLDQGGSFDHCGVGFEVIADGRSVWKSDPINKDHRFELCEVDITNCRNLELRTYTVTAAFGGHAVWIEPRVLVDPRVRSLEEIDFAANRAAAKWILERNGAIEIELMDKTRMQPPRIADLPHGQFVVVSIDLTSRPDVTDEGLAILAKLSHLESLVVSDTPVTDAIFEHIRDLPGLKVLGLAWTQVSGKGLATLTRAKIVGFEIAGMTDPDAAVAYLHRQGVAEWVNFDGMTLSPESVRLLGDIQTLKDISFRAGLLAPSELEELRKQLPGCSVRYH